MKKSKLVLLLNLSVLLLVLGSCQSVPKEIEYKLPTLDAFEPTLAPVGLVAEPLTDSELLHNSVLWEFWAYEWQDFAFALKDWNNELKVLFAP